MDYPSFSLFCLSVHLFTPPPPVSFPGAPHPDSCVHRRDVGRILLWGWEAWPQLGNGARAQSGEKSPPVPPSPGFVCGTPPSSGVLGPLLALAPLGARQASCSRGGAGLDPALPLVGAWPARTLPPGSPGGLPADKLRPPPPPRAVTSSRPEAVYASTREICIGAPWGGVSWEEAGPGLPAAGRPPGGLAAGVRSRGRVPVCQAEVCRPSPPSGCREGDLHAKHRPRAMDRGQSSPSPRPRSPPARA